MRLTGRQRKCELLSPSWQWTQDELWTPHALWARTRATRSLARRTHNGCRSRSSQIKSTRIWFDLFFLFFVSESDVTIIIYLTIKPVWAFLVRLFSWWETSLVNIQGKNANARRRFWWRHVIGDSSRLTPTIVWHNIEDLKSIASTKTDGIICRWACCHNSREDFFCSFFYSLILFASWGNWCLVYPKTNYYKKRIVIAWWSIFTPSAVICLLNVLSFWFFLLGGGWGLTAVPLPWAKDGRVH